MIVGLTVFQLVCCVTEKNDSSLRAVARLVEDVSLQAGQLIDRLLEHFGQVLDGHFQILLVIFEDLGHVVASEIECEGVSPLEGLSALL